MKLFNTFLIALTLASCSTLSPKTLTNAVVGHAAFPSLSMAVQRCVADDPEIQAQITEPFNVLVDKWQAASELEPNFDMIVALANAQDEIAEAKKAWIEIKSVITAAGLDCGPGVKSQVVNIEQTFSEIETALLSNERIVYALEWGNLLASVVLGRRGDVVKMGS